MRFAAIPFLLTLPVRLARQYQVYVIFVASVGSLWLTAVVRSHEHAMDTRSVMFPALVEGEDYVVHRDGLGRRVAGTTRERNETAALDDLER